MTADGWSDLGVDALTVQRADPGELRQEDAGQRDTRRAEHVDVGQLGSVVVLGRLPHREHVDPRHRRERDTGASQLARDRGELRLGLADQRLEVGLERVVTYEIGQRLQPRVHPVRRRPLRKGLRRRCGRRERRGAQTCGSGQAVCRWSSREFPRVLPSRDRRAVTPFSQNMRETSTLMRGFPHVFHEMWITPSALTDSSTSRPE